MNGARHKLYEAGRNAVAAVVENLADERAKAAGKGPDSSSKFGTSSASASLPWMKRQT